jgi:hypothetical protein
MADPHRLGVHGFDCVNNLGYRDGRHNFYRRGGAQKRLHSLQIRQDALPLVKTFAKGLVDRVATARTFSSTFSSTSRAAGLRLGGGC